MWCNEVDLKIKRNKLIKKNKLPSTNHVIELDLYDGQLSPNSVCLPLISHSSSDDYEPYLVEINFIDEHVDKDVNIIVISNNKIWESKYYNHISIPTYMTENPGQIMFAVYRVSPAASSFIGAMYIDSNGHTIVDTLKELDSNCISIYVDTDTDHVKTWIDNDEDFLDFAKNPEDKLDVSMADVDHITVSSRIKNYKKSNMTFDSTDIIKSRMITIS